MSASLSNAVLLVPLKYCSDVRSSFGQQSRNVYPIIKDVPSSERDLEIRKALISKGCTEKFCYVPYCYGTLTYTGNWNFSIRQLRCYNHMKLNLHILSKQNVALCRPVPIDTCSDGHCCLWFIINCCFIKRNKINKMSLLKGT